MTTEQKLVEACKKAILIEANADRLRGSGMVDDVDLKALRAIAKLCRKALAQVEKS